MRVGCTPLAGSIRPSKIVTNVSQRNMSLGSHSGPEGSRICALVMFRRRIASFYYTLATYGINICPPRRESLNLNVMTLRESLERKDAPGESLSWCESRHTTPHRIAEALARSVFTLLAEAGPRGWGGASAAVSKDRE